MSRRERIAILGGGLMGSAIAADFLAAGHPVALTVSSRTSASTARERVEQVLGRQAEQLEIAADTAAAATAADVVLECLPEELGLKHGELRVAEQVAPEALLATNTSSLSVARVAGGLDDPERLVGIHYLNPPGTFRVTEVVPGTAPDTNALERAVALLRSVERVPVVLRRDAPGFLINRLQMALLRECVNIVDEGIAGAEDVDLIVQRGLGRRWAALGPFATVSLGGPD